jgi:WD40 repeat protein
LAALAPISDGIVSFGKRSDRSIQYNAFISYRRTVDIDLAESLRHALQGIAKPWYKRRALRIFHDINSLAANYDVGAAIHEALAESEFLILLASPESAASPYVQDELEYWLANKSPANLLIAQTGGKLRWNPSREDFDWGVTDCLPKTLHAPLRALPNYVDLTTVRDLPEPDRTAAFQARVVTLAAALHHMAPDDLSAQDLREHRRTRRVALATVATLAMLLIIASGLGGEAFYQARQARAGQAAADFERNQATSDALAGESVATGETDPVLARQEALAAWKLSPSAQADYARLTAAALPGLAVLDGPAADSVAVSPHSDIVAAGESDGIQLWNASNYHSAGTLVAGDKQDNKIISVAFSSSGATLAAGGDNGVVQIWNSATHRLERMLTTDSGGTGIITLRFSDDGSYLAAASQEGIQLWDTANWRLLQTFPEDLSNGYRDENVDDVTFGLHDTLLAAVSGDSVLVFNLATGELAETLATGWVGAEAASPAGTVLAIATSSGIQLWNLATGQLASTITGSGEVASLAFSPDGSLLVAGNDNGTIRFWNAATRQLDNTLSVASDSTMDDLAFSANGATLAVSDTAGAVHLFDVAAAINQPSGTMKVRSYNPFVPYYFNPDSVFLMAENSASTGLWSVLTGRLTATLPIAVRGAAAVNPDGTMMALAIGDDIELWNVPAGHLIAILPLGASTGTTLLEFSPNGATLVAVTRLGLQLWNTSTHQPTGTIPVGASVSGITFSPNSATLAIASSDSAAIQLWNVAARKLTGTLPPGQNGSGATSLSFSFDSTTLAAPGNNGVAVWNVTNRTFTGTVPSDQGESVAFSPDDSVLAIGGLDATILWDMSTGQQLARFPGGEDDVAFEANGTLILDGANTLTRWSVPYLAGTVSYLCRQAGGPFTQAEWKTYVHGVPYEQSCP